MNFLESLPSGADLARWGLLAGCILLATSFLALAWTRWGQSQPLQKCIFLSLFAHLLLGIYSTTVEIVSGASLTPEEPAIRIANLDTVEQPLPKGSETQRLQPWDTFHDRSPTPYQELSLARTPEPDQPLEFQRTPDEVRPWAGNANLARLPQSDQPTLKANVVTVPVAAPRRTEARASEKIEALPAQSQTLVSQAPPGPAEFNRPPPTPSAAPEFERQPPVEAPPLDRIGKLPEFADTKAVRPDLLLPPGAEPPRRSDPLAAAGLSLPNDSAPRTAEAVPRGVPQAPAPIGRLADASLPGGTPQPVRDPALAGLIDKPADTPPPAAGIQLNRDPLARRQQDHDRPQIYEFRFAPNREQVAAARGGGRETEQAVEAALRWLATAQNRDGSWLPNVHGGGRELRTGGQNRDGAGAKAVTGVTGLALLAFLGAGHTHREGRYQDVVRQGLEFLLAAQARDGNLGGSAATFEFMYCHGMASFALSEAYAMSGDPALRGPVERAVRYTVSAQHPTQGGWRYRPGDLGDTSQHGWQVMALKSAELAGISIPQKTKDGAVRYLKGVSRGRSGGLASYRPGEQVTRPMTAEALLCRQFLGMARGNPASDEAGAYVLEELPGQGKTNYYYWYYATLSVYQLGGDSWERWNEALGRTLLASQEQAGDLAGSWPTDSTWGGHGGRVYTTALAALCLEVYYRYLPLYNDSGLRGADEK